jgi:hypothetical protein
MIICDTHQFAFIHIPKCAGTSVRRALRSLDTTGEAFFRIVDHPVMGPVHLAHLTLADLEEHYPETFDKLLRYQSMAIVRDPLERFYSAVFQHLREFKHVPQSAFSAALVEQHAEAIVAHFEGAPSRFDLEYVHFNRQSDFIELKGQRIVRDIFAVTRMADAAMHLHRLTGVEIGDDRRNPTTELRFAALRPMQRMLRERYARLVSAERRAQIREKMSRAGFYTQVPAQRFFRPGGRIEDLVRDFYARDFEIFEESERKLEPQAA